MGFCKLRHENQNLQKVGKMRIENFTTENLKLRHLAVVHVLKLAEGWKYENWDVDNWIFVKLENMTVHELWLIKYLKIKNWNFMYEDNTYQNL